MLGYYIIAVLRYCNIGASRHHNIAAGVISTPPSLCGPLGDSTSLGKVLSLGEGSRAYGASKPGASAIYVHVKHALAARTVTVPEPLLFFKVAALLQAAYQIPIG